MKDMPALVSSCRHAVYPEVSSGLAGLLHQCSGLSTLRATLAIWRWRTRHRRELEERSKAAPHLLEDAGMTPSQAREEIIKHFWQA